MKVNLLAGASALMMMVGVAPTVAHAQEAEATTHDALIEEVVVTARRQEENMQSVPVAVTALSAEALEDRQITDTSTLQGAVPTLQYGGGNSTVGRKAQNFALRGLRSSAVTTYSAEIVRNPQSVADFFDLEFGGSVEGSTGHAVWIQFYLGCDRLPPDPSARGV